MVRNAAQLGLVARKRSIAPPLADPWSKPALRVAGLFAGIGGIELGLRRSHHDAALLCEIEPAAVAILEEHLSGIRLHDDIRSLAALPRSIDLIAAGFPCQDLSQAGRTAGITGSRSGLVAEVFRLLERRRVEWLLLENVSFMLQLARGRALETIVSELERLGYKWAYRVVTSRAFGLPQRRERIYLLASRHEDPRCVLLVDDAGEPADVRSFREVACGFYWTEGVRGLGWAVDSVPTLKGGSTIGIPSPPAIILPSGRIVKPDIRDAERMQGFPIDWTKPAESVAKRGIRWKLVGNAVTVDVAEWIGRRLRAPGVYDTTGDVPFDDGTRWPNCAWNVGSGRFAARLSKWPVRHDAQPLESFLLFE
ncbi:MAG TPA: DNA (cytosine-5-)-methyltransferase, partial [Thermoanaerobaculia bacterium]|nr:DNA (cytosine-5-)-methyltransferase [Thermoanaerobaculia bacterium]